MTFAAPFLAFCASLALACLGYTVARIVIALRALSARSAVALSGVRS